MSTYGNDDDYDPDEEMRKEMAKASLNRTLTDDSDEDIELNYSTEDFYEPNEEIIELDNSTGDQKKEKDRTRKRHDIPFGTYTFDEEEYNEYKHKQKLKDIRKKAGLLDDPSNYLPIGIATFYAKKKENNLYNFNKNAKAKAKYNDEIKENAEQTFETTYKGMEKQFPDIPKDKIMKIALMQMQVQKYIDEEIMNLKYPFLN